MTPWHLGYAARLKGEPQDANPFAETNDRHHGWLLGWCAADIGFTPQDGVIIKED